MYQIIFLNAFPDDRFVVKVISQVEAQFLVEEFCEDYIQHVLASRQENVCLISDALFYLPTILFAASNRIGEDTWRLQSLRRNIDRSSTGRHCHGEPELLSI